MTLQDVAPMHADRGSSLRWPLLGAFLLLAGCESEPTGPVALTPMTEVLATAEEDGSRARVEYVGRNRTHRTLYLRTHCAVEVDRRVGDAWVALERPRLCTLQLVPPTWLAPNERFYGYFYFDLFPGWEEAEFRVRFDEFSDELASDETTLGAPLPLVLRVSSPFSVVPR